MKDHEAKTGCETCREPEVLFWAVADRLDEETSARVRRLAETCPRCRAAILENETLVRVAGTLPSSQRERSAEELVALSCEPASNVDVSTLNDEEREILMVLRRVNEELEGVAGRFADWPHRLWRALTPSAGGGLRAWATSPALAYLLVLVLVYPAARGVVAGFGAPAVPMLVEAPRNLDGGARGATDSSVKLSQGQEHVVLSAFAPIDTRNRYVLRILDDVGNVLWENREAKSFDGVGTFVVVLPAHFLSTGDYVIQIEPAQVVENQEVFHVAFRIE